jgi:hypothetical protein
MIYIRGIVYVAQLSTPEDTALKNYIDQNSINQYVTNCLDYIADEAILLETMQGGVLDFAGKQEGIDYITRYSPEYNRTFNISVVVKENTLCPIVEQFKWPSDYPFPQMTIHPATGIGSIQTYKTGRPEMDGCGTSPDTYIRYNGGFYGLNNMTLLCDVNGSNRRNSTARILYTRTCNDYSYSNSDRVSIQRDMEQFISTELSKCVNFPSIEEKAGINITLLSNVPNTTITFGLSGMVINARYPFLVTIGNRPPVHKMTNFEYNKNIAFKELYDYTNRLIYFDINDASFRIVEDKFLYTDLIGLYRDYTVTRNKSDTGGLWNNLELVRVIDNNSLIYDKPMIMQFAIDDRRPALEYINTIAGYDDMHLMVAENEILEITPQGYDPDDDFLAYNYSGWKQDYDESFNYDDPECNGAQNTTLEYVMANCSIRNYDSQPKNFTNNVIYYNGYQNSSYNVSSSDRGYHELIIYTSEVQKEKLYDFQKIKILVFDLPKARIIGTNYYTDIDDKFASLEDMYLFNASNSTLGLSAILGQYNRFSSLIWNDSYNEFNVLVDLLSYNEINMTLNVPFGLAGVNPVADIRNMSTLPFGNRTPIAIHNITLKAITQAGLNDTEQYQVNVSICLPHRSPDPSYPYSSQNRDASFQANHTCCTNAYGYAGAGQQCFISVKYGSNYTLGDYTTREPLPPLNDIVYNFSDVKAPLWYNDVFKQTFTRNCSSNRGNVCDGLASQLRERVTTCVDTNGIILAPFNDERCSGPRALTGWNYASFYNLPGCITYNYSINPYGQVVPVSFEKIASTYLPPSYTASKKDGICTTSNQCASRNYPARFDAYAGITTGKYSCQGTCGGTGATAGNCVPINCVCNSTLCTGGNGDSLCDGRGYPGVGLPNGYGTPSNNGCGFGNTARIDTCSGCGITDSARCGYSGPGCTANTLCDQVYINGVTNSPNIYCDTNCEPVSCGIYNYNITSHKCYSFEDGDTCENNPDVCSELGGCCNQYEINVLQINCVQGECIDINKIINAGH